MNAEIPNQLEIKYISDMETGKSLGKALTIPKDLSCGAIKEILGHIVHGEKLRSIIFYPSVSTKNLPEIISYEYLRALRTIPRHDRLSLLDIASMQIKDSPLAILVEF